MLGLTTLWALCLMFFIHPYSFLEPSRFFAAQFSTLFDHAVSDQAVGFWQGVGIWWEYVFTGYPLLGLAILSFPLTLWAAGRSRAFSYPQKILFTVNALSIAVIALTITALAHLFPGEVGALYLYPLHPFILLHWMAVMSLVWMWDGPVTRRALLGVLGGLGIAVLAQGFVFTTHYLHTRADYRATMTYHVYAAIQQDVPPGAKIAHDHFVAVPEGYGSCHYWNDCSRPELLAAYDPDYVIFNQDFLINGKPQVNTAILAAFVREHGYHKVGAISGPVLGQEDATVTLYKRPTR